MDILLKPVLQNDCYRVQFLLYAYQVNLTINLIIYRNFSKIRSFAGYKRSAILDWSTVMANIVFRQMSAVYFCYTGGLNWF